MKTIEFLGRNIEVVEHFKEIADVSESYLFRRWYNRNQFLKAIIGTFTYNGEDDEDLADSYYEDYGELLGCMAGDLKGDWTIAIHDTETMTEEGLDDVLFSRGDSFFIEDKNGKLYFVYVDID